MNFLIPRIHIIYLKISYNGLLFTFTRFLRVCCNSWVNRCGIIIIIKTSSTGTSGKTKLFINCFRNPTSTCATENWRKHYSGKQPTVDWYFEPIQRSGVKHRAKKVIPHSSMGWPETSCKLVLYHDTSNSNGWVAAARRVCRNLVEADECTLNRHDSSSN